MACPGRACPLSAVQMDRASKRQKTVRLRNLLPHCSASAFAAFCAAAKRGELPTISTRKEVRDARDDNVDVTTPFGPLLTKLEITSASGKAIIYDGVHPLSYLYCAAQKKNFGTLLEQAFAECPCSHQRFVCNLFMGLCNRFSQPALAVRVSHEVARGWFAVPGLPAVAALSPEVSSALPWSPAVIGAYAPVPSFALAHCWSKHSLSARARTRGLCAIYLWGCATVFPNQL